jgi:hypothetical protein
MVLSKEDFKKKIDTLEISDDKKIELLEDIEDSWTDDVNEEYRARYEAEKKEMEASIANLEAETANLKAKYKERFFNNSDSVESKEDIIEDIEDKKIIDVKEI